jgi:two-component system NtrC family sensor kinase
MPGMNGRQLGERALADRPGLQILFMTGYARDAIVHQGRLDRGVTHRGGLVGYELTKLKEGG